MKLNIILLMAGRGQRTKDIADLPKPLIKVSEKEMYHWPLKAIKDLESHYKLNVVTLVEYKNSIQSSLIENSIPHNLCLLNKLTRGPLESAYLCAKTNALVGPILVLDC